MSALPLPCRHIQQIAGLLKIHSLTFLMQAQTLAQIARQHDVAW